MNALTRLECLQCIFISYSLSLSLAITTNLVCFFFFVYLFFFCFVNTRHALVSRARNVSRIMLYGSEDSLGYMSYSLLTILKNCFRHTVTGNGSINSNDSLVSLYGH